MKELQFVRYDHRKHLDAIFQVMSDPHEQKMFMTNYVSNSLRDFENWFQDRLKYFFNDFFVIESDDGQEFIGMVFSYDQQMADGHGKVSAYIAPNFRKNGLGAIAAIQFMDYLFSAYPLRRIYCDVYAYNKDSFESLMGFGFEKMGRLYEYRYCEGAFHDLILLTITREAFYEKLKTLRGERREF